MLLRGDEAVHGHLGEHAVARVSRAIRTAVRGRVAVLVHE